MASLVVSHRHAPRLRLNADLGIVCVLLVLGLALAGLAAVALPPGEAVTTGVYIVD